jgi:hypothetical protein
VRAVEAAAPTPFTRTATNFLSDPGSNRMAKPAPWHARRETSSGDIDPRAAARDGQSRGIDDDFASGHADAPFAARAVTARFGLRNVGKSRHTIGRLQDVVRRASGNMEAAIEPDRAQRKADQEHRADRDDEVD